MSTTTAQKLRDSVSKTGPWNYAWSELRLRAANEIEALRGEVDLLKRTLFDKEEIIEKQFDTIKSQSGNSLVKELEKLRTQNQELRDQLKEASVLIEKIGTTGVERTDIIQRADKWMQALALKTETQVGTDAFYRTEGGIKTVEQREEKSV